MATSNTDTYRTSKINTTITTSVHAAPKSLVITRRSGNFASPSNSVTKTRTFTSTSGVIDPAPDYSEGDYALKTTAGVSEVKSSRDKEKKDMQELNDRFANYLDKVRTLESQNRRLADELDKLKSKWGKETSQIKAMFQAELDDSRHQLDDAEKEKARLEIRVASLEDQMEELRGKLALAQQEVAINRDRVNLQNQQLADYEKEVQMLRKQLEALENERDKDKKLIEQLQEALDRAREDLDIETLAHIDAENRRQTLEEEIEFLKSVHEQEMKELAALAYRDSSPETRDYWKNEMEQAIREIQQMYDDKMDLMRADIEATYSSKLNDMRDNASRQSADVNKNKQDVKDLRNTISDYRDKVNKLDESNNQLIREIEALRRQKEEMERQLEGENANLRDEAAQLKRQLNDVMQELEDLVNNKMGLELEISAYRKLLEGEENRVAVKQLNVSTTATGDSKRGEMSARTTYQKTAKGTLSVSECPSNGRSITLENTGTKDETLTGWSITRTVDGKNRINYVLDERFAVIKPGSKITLWAKQNKPPNASANDIECDETNWGIGTEVITKLLTPHGEEKATLTQKTVYS